MVRRFLEHILLRPGGLAVGGVPLMLDDGPIMSFARLSNVLADGDGHMQVWDWKGAASLKPCVKHWNVVKKVEPATLQRSSGIAAGA